MGGRGMSVGKGEAGEWGAGECGWGKGEAGEWGAGECGWQGVDGRKSIGLVRGMRAELNGAKLGGVILGMERG
jgi:hypothetical protein